MNTTQKSSWSARNDSSRAIAVAMAFRLCVDVGILGVEGDGVGRMEWRWFPALVGVQENVDPSGLPTLCPLSGVRGDWEIRGDTLWLLCN